MKQTCGVSKLSCGLGPWSYSKRNLGPDANLRVGQTLSKIGCPEGVPRKGGCGSFAAVASTSRRLCGHRGAVAVRREHLVPTLCQLVPGAFIPLIIGSLHSAAQLALEETAAQYGCETCSESQSGRAEATQGCLTSGQSFRALVLRKASNFAFKASSYQLLSG